MLTPAKTDFDETHASGTSPSSTRMGQSASSLSDTSYWLQALGVRCQDAKVFEGHVNLMGKIVHSTKHGSRVDWKGKQVLVMGACTSAHNVSCCISYHHHVIYL